MAYTKGLEADNPGWRHGARRTVERQIKTDRKLTEQVGQADRWTSAPGEMVKAKASTFAPRTTASSRKWTKHLADPKSRAVSMRDDRSYAAVLRRGVRPDADV